VTVGTWARNAEALWRRTGDDVLVLAPEGDGVVALGHPGSEVWDVLAAPATAPEVIGALATLAGDEPLPDVERLLEDLLVLGVLDRSTG
jgi:hypothetical protein